jgi:hypothetical protein
MLRRFVTAALVTILLCGGGLRAAYAEDQRPEIDRVGISAEHGFVSGEVVSTGLFSDRVVGTLKSGLPAVVDLLYYFSARSGGVTAEDVLSFSLLYDVWEDSYTVEARDTSSSFASFASLQQAIEHLQHVKLIPTDQLQPDKSYRLHMSVMVNPLRGVDRDKMTDWVSENMRTNQDNTWREQVLNLNELISHFFSRERGAVNRSRWFETPFFTLDTLTAQNQEEE